MLWKMIFTYLLDVTGNAVCGRKHCKPRRRVTGSLPHYLALAISCIWQSHWQHIIEGSSWSAEACLTSIRNQRYGQLAAQYHQKTNEDCAGRVIPMSTAYTEDAKNHDLFFEPYHTSFAFLQDVTRFRQGGQAYVPIMATSAPVPISKATYTLANVH